MTVSGSSSRDHRHPQFHHQPPARGLDWLAAGWRILLKAPGVWLVQGLLYILILFALGLVPLLGWAAVLIAFPVLSAGMVAGVAELEAGRPLRVGHLFEGLRRHAPNLLMVGVFYLIGGLIAGLIAAAIGGSAALTGYVLGAMAGVGLAIGGGMLAAAVFTVLWAGLIMALWFAPALVLLHDVAPLEAMRLSVRACASNLLCFGLLAVMLYVLAWVAMLPAGLGMLALLPVMAGALYASYHDTFSDAPASLPQE
ncbi:MAG: BPSS1780 family membrane protein [Rhodocyclaceae bacterium]|jgi:uncharacterized membrane protein|nr:BPSS1780 family membrane protein [Rhodocyclaceae bacterium]